MVRVAEIGNAVELVIAMVLVAIAYRRVRHWSLVLYFLGVSLGLLCWFVIYLPRFIGSSLTLGRLQLGMLIFACHVPIELLGLAALLRLLQPRVDPAVSPTDSRLSGP